MRIWVALALLGCDKTEPTPEAPATPPAQDAAKAPAPAAVDPGTSTATSTATKATDVAYIRSRAGIVGVEMPGGKTREVFAGDVRQCLADARAQVIWIVDEQGLKTIDLTDGYAVTNVVLKLPDIDELVIDYGSNDRIGGRNPVDFEIGLHVKLGAAPKLAATIGCDGDMGIDCFRGPGMGKLRKDLKLRKRQLNTLKFADAGFVLKLIDRGAKRTIVQAEGPKEAKRVSIPGHCGGEPDVCGSATTIPGTPYLRVITDTERGDLYHEMVEFYDPKTKQFIDPTDPTKRKPNSGGGAEVDGLLLSSTGLGYMDYDKVYSWHEGVVFKDGAGPCGWDEPPYILPGPTWE